MRYDYDMLGNRIHQASMEAGERWMLNDVAGKPIRAWDSRGSSRSAPTYDPLRRPDGLVRDARAGAPSGWPSARVYGESQAERRSDATCAASVYQALRSGGRRHQRRATTSRATCCAASAAACRGLQDARWTGRPNRAAGTPTPSPASTTLRRAQPPDVTAAPTPDSSVIRPTYNEANLLERGGRANLRGAATSADATFVDQHRLRRQGPAHSASTTATAPARPTTTTR